MPIVSRLVFRTACWAARKGLREADTPRLEPKKHAARRHGYVFGARNFPPRASKGEIDMVSCDGKTLAFVEVRTRPVREEMFASPELIVPPGKQHLLARTPQHFFAERRVSLCPCRFGVIAIDNSPGKPRSCACRKTPFIPQYRIPQENPAERLLTTARRGTIGARGCFPCPNL
jgi:Holliday junction resolvase-like predicted endonuclease